MRRPGDELAPEAVVRRKLETARLVAFRFGVRARRRLGRPPPKVFCIGFNKTGTSSLHELFVKLGFRSHHGLRWHDRANRAVYDAFECFSDGFPRDWPALVEEYPGARFILNVRRCDTWIRSRLRHVARAKRDGTYRGGGSWGAWDDTEAAVVAWIRDWHGHHLEVLRTFRRRPDRLLVVNVVSDPDAASRVAAFLGFPASLHRPHANPGPDVDGRDHAALIDGACEHLGIPRSQLENDLLIPALLGKYESGFPVDTRELSAGVARGPREPGDSP